MLLKLALLLAPLIGAVELDSATHNRLLHSGRPQIGLWQALSAQLERDHEAQATFSAPEEQKYKAYCFDQPISHFDKTVNGTFCHRYWADATHYKEGGPIFLLDGGETSGKGRLPFMETGILEILAKATGGLSIILEHRYYGKSVPVFSFSTDDLRFLNNAEALEDSAYFIKHFEPPKSLNISEAALLKPNKAPWIYYGGSYAGARAAHMRVQYPDLVWGAIASSAVTHAQVRFPEYFDPIQKYADQSCISTLQRAIHTIDSLLELPSPVPQLLKAMFGLPGLDNGDFAQVLTMPLGAWQGQNWDPAISTDAWDVFCSDLTSGKAGSTIGLIKIPASVVNFAKYVAHNIAASCPSTIKECFDSNDDSKFQGTDVKQTWRLWLFQVCTQWGYFQCAPEEGKPSIVSKFLTLEHSSKICRQAYPPGKHFVVPEWPDVEEVNKRGGYAIESSRLAFIDGDRDPWRPATPQADIAPKRKSSASKPLHIIHNAIHHYDENGLKNHTAEPARIRDVHEFEVLFIKEWISQWKEKKIAHDK